MTSGLLYPPVGFHFLVAFELFPQTPQDGRFQEVSGLNVEMTMESIKEGGEQRFEHQLPVRTKYSDLVLKRGLFIGSGVYKWCENAFEKFEFQPVNIIISLLNEVHAPIMTWHVIHALPKKWDISSFNAEQNTVAIETLTLSYRYFKTIKIL
jgi:phage tail-like protein